MIIVHHHIPYNHQNHDLQVIQFHRLIFLKIQKLLNNLKTKEEYLELTISFDLLI